MFSHVQGVLASDEKNLRGSACSIDFVRRNERRRREICTWRAPDLMVSDLRYVHGVHTTAGGMSRSGD